MPIIRVELLEGRTVEQKREFAEMVTREGARILRCAPESINVVFARVARDDWAVDGRLMSDPKQQGATSSVRPPDWG
ncbi:4-oxalocrotonate tautomerase [Mesorhizobium sp. KR9-304]|uniref:4-oxalocrotonate tautomerase n=1 Tax=Mesorhizobium sp. KR9-304 TaxID=3156614 RepID=UPI0032B3B78F